MSISKREKSQLRNDRFSGNFIQAVAAVELQLVSQVVEWSFGTFM